MANETEQKIMQVARRQFVQKGFAATRMQSIADEAGINKAMVHYYFRSKEKLYREIVAHTLSTVIPHFGKGLQAKGDTLDRLDSIVRTYMEAIRANPDAPFFIMSELAQQRPDFITELRKRVHFEPAIFDLMQQMSTDIEAGKIRQIQPFQLMLNVMSMCGFPFIAKPIFTNLMQLSESDFEALMEHRAQEVITFVRAALTPR